MRVLVVHNPNSGDDDHEGERLVESMRRLGHEVRYAQSKSRWQSLLDQDVELVAVAGGDGTVSEVARMTARRGIPIAILPTGTANNIARFLGLTGTSLEDLIAGWNDGHGMPFDLGVVKGPWGSFEFLESVGVGLLADLMSEIDSGSSGYVNELAGRVARVEAALDVLQSVLSRSRPAECEIQLDDEVIRGRYVLVEILNFGSAGPNLRLAPHADGADGLLDVVLVTADERQALEAQLIAMRRDELQPPPALRVRHARRVALRADAGSLVHLDDTLWTPEDGTAPLIAEAHVDAGVLTFLTPAHGRATTPSKANR